MELSGSVSDALHGFLVGRFVRAIPDASPVPIDRDFGRDSTEHLDDLRSARREEPGDKCRIAAGLDRDVDNCWSVAGAELGAEFALGRQPQVEADQGSVRGVIKPLLDSVQGKDGVLQRLSERPPKRCLPEPGTPVTTTARMPASRRSTWLSCPISSRASAALTEPARDPAARWFHEVMTGSAWDEVEPIKEMLRKTKPSDQWPHEPPAPEGSGPDSGVREPRRPTPSHDAAQAAKSLRGTIRSSDFSLAHPLTARRAPVCSDVQ